MLGKGHRHLDRVSALLEAAKAVMDAEGWGGFGVSPLGLELRIFAPSKKVPSDATNYLGGIGDTLENKDRRGKLDHLGHLAFVHLYQNDSQIQEVHYFLIDAPETRFEVTFWNLQKLPASDD